MKPGIWMSTDGTALMLLTHFLDARTMTGAYTIEFYEGAMLIQPSWLGYLFSSWEYLGEI